MCIRDSTNLLPYTYNNNSDDSKKYVLIIFYYFVIPKFIWMQVLFIIYAPLQSVSFSLSLTHVYTYMYARMCERERETFVWTVSRVVLLYFAVVPSVSADPSLSVSNRT